MTAIPNEIEKKFLPNGDDWKEEVVQHEVLLQVYLKDESGENFRVRLHLDKYSADNEVVKKSHAVKCYKTYMGEENGVPVYAEKESPLDKDLALDLICGNINTLVMKKRSYVPFHQFTFEIDTYLNSDSWIGVNELSTNGVLETIEVEFANSQDILVFDSLVKPSWLGDDVTKDKRFKNSNLAKMGKNEKHQEYVEKIIFMRDSKIKSISRKM